MIVGRELVRNDMLSSYFYEGQFFFFFFLMKQMKQCLKSGFPEDPESYS